MKTIILAALPAILLGACAQPAFGPAYSGHAALAAGAYQAPGVAYAQGNRLPAYAAPQGRVHTPSANAYGTRAGAQSPYGTPGLRGRSGAEPQYAYGEIGGVVYDTDDATLGLQGRLGYRFSTFVGVELDASIGLTDDTETIIELGEDDLETKVGIDHQLAGFLVGRAPVSNTVNVLGRVGFHTTDLGVDAGIAGEGASADQDYDGLAAGLGVELATGPTNALRLDATYFEGGDEELGTLAATFQKRF